jgi:hypothetical protein
LVYIDRSKQTDGILNGGATATGPAALRERGFRTEQDRNATNEQCEDEIAIHL